MPGSPACRAPSVAVLYDDRRGSELFEDITRLPEYYATRTERTTPGRGRPGDRGAGEASRAVVELGADASAADFPRTMAATLGEDAMKDPSILVQAHDAAAGVAAAFNRNLLHLINTEPEGTIPVGGFRHPARWNAAESRIAMHLEATRHLAFSVAGRAFSMVAGETIHTEISVKYRAEDARGLPRAAGWFPAMEWTDREDHFVVILARRSPAGAHRGIASPCTVDASRRGILS